MDGKGVVLDPNGFAICTNNGSQFHRPSPQMAPITWWSGRITTSQAAISSDSGDSSRQGARTNALVICHAANSQAYPAVAADKGTFLVAWQDYRDSPGDNFEARIYGTRVSGDGSVFDPDGVRLSSAVGGRCRPCTFAGWEEVAGRVGGAFATTPAAFSLGR